MSRRRGQVAGENLSRELVLCFGWMGNGIPVAWERNQGAGGTDILSSLQEVYFVSCILFLFWFFVLELFSSPPSPPRQAGPMDPMSALVVRFPPPPPAFFRVMTSRQAGELSACRCIVARVPATTTFGCVLCCKHERALASLRLH